MTSLIRGQAAPRCAFNSEQAFPMTLEEITTQWLSNALGVEVKDFQITSVNEGTCSKIFLTLNFAHGVHTEIPTRVCIKGGFNPKVRETAPEIVATFRREAEFYYYFAPLTKMLLPKTWFCGTDIVNGQGIVIMSDIAHECTFGTPSQPWAPDHVEQALGQLASLHARTWNGDEKAYPGHFIKDGIKLDSPTRNILRGLLSPEMWAVRFDQKCCLPVAEPLRDRQRMKNAFEALWKHCDSNLTYHCIIHGDDHIGNTFIQKDGTPGFIDWQCLEYGPAILDLAYFLVGALRVEDRRKHEGPLIEGYLNTLYAEGGPKLTKDDIWDEYRRYILHGFGWALVPDKWQPYELICAMSERYSTAIMDHKTLELLAV